MISHSLLQTIILMCIFATIIAVERAIIESKRIKKEQKFLYQQGVASENFNYKGKGLFENTVQRVYSKNESIKKGDPIMIMSLDGFNLIVKKTKS